MKHRCLLLFGLLLLLRFASFAQAQKAWATAGAVGFQSHWGTFLTHKPKAAYLRDSYTFYHELYYQRQTNGSQPWHRVNGWPQWGISLFWGNTGSRRYMGPMGGAFGFVNVPLLKTGAFTSKLRTGMGLGWVQKPYDKNSNHKNVLIGSPLNGFIQFLWQNEWRLARRLYLNAGFSFSHLSNGGSTMPNLGLNMPATSLGVRYGAAEGPKKTVGKTAFQKQKTTFWVYASLGTKQAPWVESKRYIVNTLSAEAAHALGYSSAVSGGLILFYDRALEVHPAGIPSLKRQGNFLQAGLFAAYEHRFGKLSVPLQLGAYVYNKDLQPSLFQNLGLRYRLSNRWSAQVILKTHMGQADHIHLGAGYHF